MEAVPRMPMLAFELKQCSEHEDFTSRLKTYIEDFYNENPENYNKECQELEQLCQIVVNIPHDFTGCSTLKKYFAQLQYLQSRFPLEEGGILAMPFTWECVYTGKSVTVADIRFEQACVLYNVGALHSILGALDNRQSPEGMKVSCTHFQCAAWAFQHVRDTFGMSMTTDLTFDLLSFQSTLMLAQSQECILEKSMSDNRKNTITAKIACQIVDYYKQALKYLESKESAVVGSKRLKDWKRRAEMKVSYHEAITYFYLGSESTDRQKWGEAVAYLQAAHTKLVDTGKMAKSDDNEDIATALTFANDVIAGKYNAAKKDNDFVYHEKVPELESLPELKGASLVKGIPFDPTDENISGPDIFRRLVPMEAHQASSVYSEVKANLLRSVSARIEEKDGELQQYLSSLQLEASNLFPEGPSRLPQELLEKCAAISVKPGAIQDLIDAMQSLSTIATDTEVNISEIFNLLETEATAEQEFQKNYGKRGHNVGLDEIEKECSKYKEGLQTASQSNQDLHKAMGTHISNLKLLSSSLDEIQKALPSPEQQKTGEDEEVIQLMRRLMDKVDEMKTQRTTLEQKLRHDIHADDVTSALVTREGSSQEEFFQTQLKKHDNQIDLIDRNLTAQANILKALTESNAKYARIRKLLKDCQQRREAMIQDLKESYDVYEELLAKTQKGIEFYRKLEDNVKRLLERTHRVCKVQQEERDQILARFKPKAPPPSRPSAPKPRGAGVATTPAVTMAEVADPATLEPYPGVSGLPPEAGGRLPGVDPAAVMGMPSMQGEQPLKLKDFLPFMKPKTFGADRGKPTKEIPGLPTTAASSLPSSQSGSPLHLYRQPASQPASPAHMAAIGELRLDGGRLPASVDEDMSLQESLSMSQQHHVQIPQSQQQLPLDATRGVRPGMRAPEHRGAMPPYPVNNWSAAGVVSGASSSNQTELGGLSVQSPTAPPGAPSASSSNVPQSQPSQPPGGPQAIAQSQRHTPSPNHQPPTASHPQPPTASQHQPATTSHTGLQHGYTQLQYGAMGQPSYGGHAHPMYGHQPLPHQPLPTQQQPLPTQQQPLPAHSQPMPQQQLPTQNQPLPTQQQPLPTQQQPLPAQYQPLPHQPLPTQQQPLPTQQQPFPTQQQPLPTQQQTFPTHSQPMPQQQQPLPTQHQPLPTKQQPLPTQQQPYPNQLICQPGSHSVISQTGSSQSSSISAQQSNYSSANLPVASQPGLSTHGGEQQSAAEVSASHGRNVGVHPGYPASHLPDTSPGQMYAGHSVQENQNGTPMYLQQAPGQIPGGSNVPSGAARTVNQAEVTSQPQGSYSQPTVPTQVPSWTNQSYLGSVSQPQVVASPGSPSQIPRSVNQGPGNTQPHGQTVPSQTGSNMSLGPSNMSFTSQSQVGHSQSSATGEGIQTQARNLSDPHVVPSQQPAMIQGQVTFNKSLVHQSTQYAQTHAGQSQNHSSGIHANNQAISLAGQVPNVNPIGQAGFQQPISSQNASSAALYHTSHAVPPGQIQNVPSQTSQHPPSFHNQPQMGQSYSMVKSGAQSVYNQQGQVVQTSQPQVYPTSNQSAPGQPYQGGQYTQVNSQVTHPNQIASATNVNGALPSTNYYGTAQSFAAGQTQQPGMRYPPPSQVPGGTQNVRQAAPVSQSSATGQVYQSKVAQPQQNIGVPQGGNITHSQNTQGQYGIPQQGVGQLPPAAAQPTEHVRMQPYQGQNTAVIPQGQGQVNTSAGQGQMINQSYKVPSQGQLYGQALIQGQGHVQHQGQAQVQGQMQDQRHTQGQGQVQGQGYVQGQGQVQGQGYVQGQGQVQGHGLMQTSHGQGNMFSGQGTLPHASQASNIPSNPNFPKQPSQMDPQRYSPASQTQSAPLPQVQQQNQASHRPLNGQQTTGSGQDLLSQMQGFGVPQAATLTPGILQPSSVGCGPMTPMGGTPTSTPTETPRPTPSQTPQPAQNQVNQSPQRQLPPPAHGHHGGMPAQAAGRSMSPLKPTVASSVQNNNLPLRRQDSGASNASSLDDILSSSPGNVQVSPSKESVLRPRVVTEEEQEKQREQQMKTSLTLHREPYSDEESLNKFVNEVEAYVKHVEGLTKHTLSGPTPLDKEWRDLAEHQERETRGLSMAIARCYPMKNRSPDVMPYDATRVELKMGQDDYINASHIKDVASSCPCFIAAQSPIPVTFVDFWQMVYEEGTEVIVMLNSLNEPGMQNNHVYWPVEKSRSIHHGPFQLNLQSERRKKFWVERILTLSHKQTRHTRSVVHLQFDSWFPSGQPDSPAQLLQFVSEVQSCYVQQRSLIKPVLVHCSDGIGRTGAFVVIYAAVQEMDHGKGIVDLVDVIQRLRLQRKWMVREKEQMKFCYETVVYHAQDLLMKRGILVNKASFEDKPGSKPHSVHTPTEDFIFGSPLPLSAIQNTVAKMTLKERQEPDGGEQISPSQPAPSEQNSGHGPTLHPTPTHSSSSSPQIAHKPQGGSTPHQPHAPLGNTATSQNATMRAMEEFTMTSSVNKSPERSVTASVEHVGQQLDPMGVSQNIGCHGGTVSQTSVISQPGEASSAGTVNNASLSLAELQNPQTFNLGSSSTPPNKKRVTKATFDGHTASTVSQRLSEEEGDPLSMLDPMWTTRK